MQPPSNPNTATSADILQGLNVVQASVAQQQQQPPPPSDAHNLLLPPSYSDLGQLDIWTNIPFASDEPFVPGNDSNSEDGADDKGESSSSASDLVKRKRDMLAKRVFDPRPHSPQPPPQSGPSAPIITAVNEPYDLQTLFAMAGNQFAPELMSLNHLLGGAPYPNPFHAGFPFTFPPASAAAPPPPAPQHASSSSSSPTQPPSKKVRFRKASSTPSDHDDSPTSPTSSIPPTTPVDKAPSTSSGPIDSEDNPTGRPLTTAEDKRRRNTQASARFRLKKKEREVAMETKCRDLESRVGELERECEALRRENGWLKGLVVGVTGGTGMPMTLPPGPGLSSGLATPTAASSGSSSGKRKRDAAESS